MFELNVTSQDISNVFGMAHNELLKKIDKLNRFSAVGVEGARIVRGREFRVFHLELPDALKVISSISPTDKTLAFTDYFFDLVSSGVDAYSAYNSAIEVSEKVEVRKKSAVTYIVKSMESGLYKIGRTNRDPHARVASLQTSTPYALELHAYIIGDEEKALHEIFECKRKSGEWFDIDEQDIHNIQQVYRGSFNYENTFMDKIFNLWHVSGNSEKEPEISDFFETAPTANQLNIAKQSIIKHMNNGEHYKTVFVLVKQDLEGFGTSLYLNLK